MELSRVGANRAEANKEEASKEEAPPGKARMKEKVEAAEEGELRLRRLLLPLPPMTSKAL